MSVNMKVTGFRDIEKALAKLPAGTAKGVARRALKKELKPVAQMADMFSPFSSDSEFLITSRIRRGQLSDSYAKRGRSVLNMYVGTSRPDAHLIEFGTGPRYQKNGRFTGSVSPTPMLQPAWDAHKNQIFAGLGKRLFDEIEKTVARRAKKAAR